MQSRDKDLLCLDQPVGVENHEVTSQSTFSGVNADFLLQQ